MDGKALGIIETVGLVPAVEAGDVAVKTADVRLIGSQAVGGGLVSILITGDVSAVKASVDAGSTAAARLGEVVSMTVIARTAEGLEGILLDEARSFRCIPGGTVVKTTRPEEALTPIAVGGDSEPDPAEEQPASVQEIPEAPPGGLPASEGEAVLPLQAPGGLPASEGEAVLPLQAPGGLPASEGEAVLPLQAPGGLPASEGEAVLPLQAPGGLPASEGEEVLHFDMAELKKLKVIKLRRLARQLPAFSIPRGEIKYARKRDLLGAFTIYINTLEK